MVFRLDLDDIQTEQDHDATRHGAERQFALIKLLLADIEM